MVRSVAVTATDAHRAIDAIWRIKSARLIAGLARIVRDIGLAEELAQDALVAALERWPQSGVPDNPDAWLMATAKHRASEKTIASAARPPASRSGVTEGVAERVTSSTSDLNLPLSRAHAWQDLPRTVVPPLATLAEARESPLGRDGQADLAAQSASISRPCSSTGTRRASCTAGGGLGSFGGLRPRKSRICLMTTVSWR